MNDPNPANLHSSRALWDMFVTEVTRPEAASTPPVAAAILDDGGDAVEEEATPEPLVQHPRPATVRQWCWLADAIPRGRGQAGLVNPQVLLATGITEEELAAWAATGDKASPAHAGRLRSMLDDFHSRWPQMDLGLAIRWAIVLRATENDNPLRTCSQWSSAGPHGWLLYAAGITRKEAAFMQQNGTMPPVADLRGMAALRGITVPAT